MDPSSVSAWLDVALEAALNAGSWAMLVLPVSGAVVGLVLAGAIAYFGAQLRWRHRLDSPGRGPSSPRGLPGQRVVIEGRLRAPRHDTVSSFADGRPVLVSILTCERGATHRLVAKRAVELVIETPDAVVAVEGELRARRTKGRTTARDVPADIRRSHPGPLWVVDVEEGERVAALGRLDWVTHEALREPAAALGLSGRSIEREPVLLTVLELETPKLVQLLSPARDRAVDALRREPLPASGAARRWALIAAAR